MCSFSLIVSSVRFLVRFFGLSFNNKTYTKRSGEKGAKTRRRTSPSILFPLSSRANIYPGEAAGAFDSSNLNCAAQSIVGKRLVDEKDWWKIHEEKFLLKKKKRRLVPKARDTVSKRMIT